jgi:hypothetical protein
MQYSKSNETERRKAMTEQEREEQRIRIEEIIAETENEKQWKRKERIDWIKRNWWGVVVAVMVTYHLITAHNYIYQGGPTF